MTSEIQLIERIRSAFPSRVGRELRVGIGDDAAVLAGRVAGANAARRREWVWTCDSFLENVHFLAKVHPPEVVGYKSLARAVSDLAALGATPRFFLLGLALPSERVAGWFDRFLAGMARAARRFRLVLAGGDTAQYSTVAISISVLGEIERGCAVLRSGARPGDRLYVSGRIGAAQLGLELVLRGWHRRPRWRQLLRPHFYPEPRLALGRWLARNRLASAMIDLSDGLSTDARHLCEASGVGAQIRTGRIPAVRVPSELRARGLDAAKLALDGGEDYELLFTVSPRRARSLPRTYQGVALTEIGEVVRGRGITLVDAQGRKWPLAARGWDHFTKRC